MNHAKPTLWRRLRPTSRRGKIVTGIVSFVMVAATGVALALWLTHAPIKGGVTSNDFEVLWKSGSGLPDVTDPDGMTCAATTDAAGALVLNAANAYPGGSCIVQGQVYVKGSSGEGGKITGLDLTLPEGWTAVLTAGCGAPVVRGAATTPVSWVAFKLTMTEAAEAGSSGTFAATDGVQVAPASADAPLNCTP